MTQLASVWPDAIYYIIGAPLMTVIVGILFASVAAFVYLCWMAASELGAWALRGFRRRERHLVVDLWAPRGTASGPSCCVASRHTPMTPSCSTSATGRCSER